MFLIILTTLALIFHHEWFFSICVTLLTCTHHTCYNCSLITDVSWEDLWKNALTIADVEYSHRMLHKLSWITCLSSIAQIQCKFVLTAGHCINIFFFKKINWKSNICTWFSCVKFPHVNESINLLLFLDSLDSKHGTGKNHKLPMCQWNQLKCDDTKRRRQVSRHFEKLPSRRLSLKRCEERGKIHSKHSLHKHDLITFQLTADIYHVCRRKVPDE